MDQSHEPIHFGGLLPNERDTAGHGLSVVSFM
jgi:hypothetical protein